MSRADEAEVRLPRPPGVIRRALAAHPLAVDVTIVVCYVIGCLLGVLFDFVSGAVPLDDPVTGQVSADPADWFALPGYLAWPWWPIAVLRVGVVAVALLFRRRYPLACLVAVTVALFGYHGVQSAATSVALLFMIYGVPVFRSVRSGWVGFAIALAGTILTNWIEFVTTLSSGGALTPGDVVGAPSENAPSTPEFIIFSVMAAVWYLAILMFGINVGNRQRYIAAVIDRAHQLARERDQLAQLAVAEERSRIAREMHDIVAHSVSVMIALSEGAARAAPVAPEAAAEAMARSAETGRTALAEMRRLLGALHDSRVDRAELVPQPGVQDLPELVRGFREAGIDVRLTVSGEAAGDRGQELAVYRVAQEGLTNVLRYAGTGARAEVDVRRLLDRAVVDVRDFGPAPGVTAPVTGIGSGRGIAGLRERARVFGGEIEAGPAGEAGLAGGGWLLRAELPVDAAAREHSAERAGSGEPREKNDSAKNDSVENDSVENGEHGDRSD
ncbi:MAG: sensor histidine kinase [Leucobacter sp.]